MSKQLLDKIDGLVGELERLRELAILLPDANNEIEYAVSNSSVLIFIPYALHILAEWQERLARFGFVRADLYGANEYGITVHENYPRDACSLISMETGQRITLWLCPDHPKATIKKGSIPQL
jgi:hypothetical protein